MAAAQLSAELLALMAVGMHAVGTAATQYVIGIVRVTAEILRAVLLGAG